MTIETLTDEYRILLWDITGQHPANDRADAVAKALRIIDTHAAERAALTEQVAQLTRERDQIKVRLAVSRGCRKVAQSEVARLTAELESLRNGEIGSASKPKSRRSVTSPRRRHARVGTRKTPPACAR